MGIQFEEVFEKFPVDHPRLVIPYYNEDKLLIGFVCRAFKNEQPKYIQLRIDKDSEFLYGLDKLDTMKPFIALEGQIDSMFLKNAMAVGNANYGAKFLADHKDNAIIVPDNDFRRNPSVCKQLRKAIESGFKVCMLPSTWKKDVNDIVKSGVSSQEIEDYIFNNVKQGPSALMEFVLEKRC
jgi:DNA primase